MPIKIGGKRYAHFKEAVAAVSRRKGKKKIRDPKAYVAAIEKVEHKRGK